MIKKKVEVSKETLTVNQLIKKLEKIENKEKACVTFDETGWSSIRDILDVKEKKDLVFLARAK